MDASDEELVARAIAAVDQQAYGELVRRHQGRVRAWLRQLTGDKDRADDLAQDTFVRAWHKLSTFSGAGKFSAWLLKIAYNLFLQEIRANKRRKRLVDAMEENQVALGATIATAADGRLPDLPKMLSVLSVDERLVVTLCQAYGYSHGEASEVTGIPLGTVKSHIRRGMKRIRETFDIGSSSQ